MTRGVARDARTIRFAAFASGVYVEPAIVRAPLMRRQTSTVNYGAHLPLAQGIKFGDE